MRFAKAILPGVGVVEGGWGENRSLYKIFWSFNYLTKWIRIALLKKNLLKTIPYTIMVNILVNIKI